MATFDEFRRSLEFDFGETHKGKRFEVFASGSLKMILNGARQLNINQSSIDTIWKQALGDTVDVLFRNAYVAAHEVGLTLDGVDVPSLRCLQSPSE
jgi:hypothetical protein